MFKSRFFRILVCAVVICSIVFNVVSIPTKALVVADDIALGITALLLLAAAGMVIVPQASQDISNVGQSFRTSMLDWGKSTDTYDDVVVWIDAFSLYDPSGGDVDDDDSPNETKVKLARGLLAGIAAWVCSTIMAGRVETEGAAVPDGYAYYNDILLPIFPECSFSGYPYKFLILDGDYYTLIYSQCGVIFDPDNTTYPYTFDCVGNPTVCYFRSPIYNPTYWTSEVKSIYSKSFKNLLWDNSELVVSNVKYNDTIIIEPSIYVGDLPQQIQNSEKDEDDIVLPPEIDYSKLIQDGQTLQQSVTDTMSQLADGTLTYEDYLSKIESVTETVPDSGTSTDTWTPPENPGQFALDLSNYFPFCIPFDLYDFFSCLNADPVAPVIHWEIALPGGSTYPIELDLSPFDSVAQLLRRLQLLLFIVGLAVKTRDLIKG